MDFLLQAAPTVTAPGNIPIYVAVIMLIGSVIGSSLISGVVMFFFTRQKYNAEVTGQQIKNFADNMKNFDFGNEVFNTAAAQITKYREENTRLADENHELKQKLKLKEFEIAEETGKRKQAVEDREKVFIKIEQLEDEIKYEKNHCQQQIMELGLKYESRARWMEARIETLATILRGNNIEIPEDEYNEAEALKGLVRNDGNS